MPSTVTTPLPRRTKAPAAWVPREHGAWSWLVSPVIAGAIVVGPAVHQVFVLGVALAGYLFFNAASWWAKMPVRRRDRTLAPMVTYAIVAGLMVLGLLATAGWGVVGWLAVLAVPLLFAFVFTLRGAGRSLASGLLTALSSSSLVLITMHPDLPTLLRDFTSVWGWAFMIVYGQTTCTLFAVKSMIRERMSNRFLAASVGWHVAWVLAVAVGTLHGLPLVWPLFFMLGAVRAAGFPLYVRQRAFRPMTIGLVELGYTLLMLGLMVQPGV
jgi:hypothetical protein